MINIIRVPTGYITVCFFFFLFQHEENEAMENEIEGARVDFVVTRVCVCVS